MTSSSSNLKRSSSLGRLTAANDQADDYRYKMAIEKLRCDLVGFPYCCNRHYCVYRRPPYYADIDYPYYSRWYDRSPYWYDWPASYYHRQPWYYDDYYKDYVRGYEEGLKKYGAESTRIRRAASSTDLVGAGTKEVAPAEDEDTAAAATVTARMPPPPPPQAPLPPLSYYDRYYPPYWYHNYYYRQPYYWRRYLDSRAY